MRIVELVSWLMVSVPGKHHRLVIVTILDMGERLWRFLRMKYLIAILGHDLGALILLDGAGAF